MRKLFFAFFSVLLSASTAISGAELRAFCRSTADARITAVELGARYEGHYAFIDHIYVKQGEIADLNAEYVKIREYIITPKVSPQFVVTHKKRDLAEGNHTNLFTIKTDSPTEAGQSIPYNYEKKLSFFREGWQYTLEDVEIQIEEIQGMPPSIEIVASSKHAILELFTTFGVIEIMKDSVSNYLTKQKL